MLVFDLNFPSCSLWCKEQSFLPGNDYPQIPSWAQTTDRGNGDNVDQLCQNRVNLLNF